MVDENKNIVEQPGDNLEDKLKEFGGKAKSFLKKVGRKAVVEATNILDKGMEYVDRKSAEYKKRLEDEFYTDGKFDKEKADKFFAEAGDKAKIYGNKAVEQMKDAYKTGQEGVKKTLDKIVPSDKLYDEKYAGMGRKASGIILTYEFENCLNFCNEAEKKIPANVTFRAGMLQDIRDSVSGNPEDLLNFYNKTANVTNDTAVKKVANVRKYLMTEQTQ